ncbi:unnamed protein product [Schistosoma margrebowiei]|uniref:Uncharacterized protein n=1 Tax=Schistosoma margrebowiei TaxID=48269 RepID=A0A183MFS6_9TREM|nr:unnamed protein product [Schistosoma margrebowiei]
MSSPINKSKESKDLIDFDCDFNSPTHKFSEIQLMFDPLIPTSVTSDKNKRNGHVFLNPYAEPSDTSNECKTEHSPFDLMLDYSSGPIGSHLVKPNKLLLPHTVKDANNVLKNENFHLSNKKLIFPSVMDVKYDTSSAKSQVSTSSEIDLKGNQQDLFSFSQTVTPWCLRKDDKNNPNSTTINQEGLYSTPQLTHFIANSQPTDELKLFVSFVQSLRRQKYNKPNTSTLISDLDSDSKQNENNSASVYSPPDTWAYDCVYSDSVTNVMLKNSHTSINLLSLTSSSAGYQQMNPLWKTETAASNVSYIYPKCKEYFGSQNNTPAHWTNTPRWCIPQLEVRITAHLNTKKKSYQSCTTNNSNSVNSETTNNSPVNPRLRLVCDPTSTLVNELMLEALANDLIPQEIVLDVNHFQLRLQGRAELLRPDARLCDCYQVQLCHRLDQPLRLILESKDVDQPYMEKTLSINEEFIPQNFFTNNRPTPTEEDIFISYSVFQNALDKFRSCIVENYAQVIPLVDSESWLKDVHCASSSLCQSVKAVLAAVCYGMAFSDVINALGNIQVCIMDIVYDIGLNNKVTGFKRHDNKNFNSFRSDSQQSTTQENWFSSSYKRKQTRICHTKYAARIFIYYSCCLGVSNASISEVFLHVMNSPTPVSNLQSTLKNTSKTLVNLKRDIKPQSRKKLHNLILSLTKNLLCQLSAFFIWRQVNISVNPQLIGNSNFLSNGVSNDSFSYLTNKQLYHTKNGRPKAMLIADDVDGEFFNDRQQSEQKKEVKSSIDCLDAIVVGLIAIHNPPPRKTIGAYNSNVISNNATVNSSLSGSSSPSQTNPNTSSTRTDGYYCVRLGLVYAGRPLSKVYPSALTTHHDNINDNHYRSSPYKNHAKEISWTNNHLSRDSQNKCTRDYFISDPGRYQTIQSGFPKVLQFDQWFKFPNFTISQLPREAMLAISLFWCKKLNMDNFDECSTLRQIQQQGGGLTGPFKEGVITKWLQSQNITELDYKRALDNFLRSLAGCCVATYVLGVGDRHNDNIMIRYSGHVFHVDFSKVFGNSQTFAGIKRDRVPFVLTQDMLHVLNTYSKDVTNLPHGVNNSSGFGYTPGHGSSHSQQGVQIFIDRCCEAYNLLRHRSYQLISLLELSLSMNIPGLNRDCIRFVLRALRLELNDQEASQYFTELVRKTLHSKSSSLNFFVHGLAQVKQAAHGGGVSGTNTNASDNSSPPIINNQSNYHWNTDNNMNSSNNKRVNNNNSNISGKLVNDSKTRSPPTISNSLSNHTGTGQIFSFNPKRFTNDSDGTIDAIVVEIAVKKKTDDKHSDYYFPMNVWRENCRVPTRVYRRVSDLEELETRLQECFPNSAVTKTVSHIMNALNSISISSTRSQDHVQSLTDSLLSDDDIVSKSAIVYTFFHSVLFDERFTSEDMPSQGLTTSTSSSLINCWSSSSPLQDYLPEKSKEYTTPLLIPSLSSSSLSSFHLFHNNSDDLLTSTYKVDHLPAVHIQLYLSENSRRLDVLIKHARCLFSYDLIPNDIQCGFIEVSAWHSVHIGENIPFGQIYIQLKSIRPGHVYSNWYILCSDPACLS